MTENQKYFKMGIKILKRYKKISQERPLTEKEFENYKTIKANLWSKISLFAKATCSARISNYRTYNDALPDLLQECYEIFDQKLLAYDPDRTAPTTFFVRQFHGKISEYLCNESQFLTRNDSDNLGKVRKAIRECESLNIQWDLELLSAMTGLSVRVVRNTLYYGSNSIRANDEALENLASDYCKTPEEILVTSEQEKRLYSALSILTPDEFRVFTYKINLGGTKDRNYNDVCMYFNLSVSKVKQIYSSAIAKLQNNAEIIELLKPCSKSVKPRLRLNDNITDELQNSFTSALRGSNY